MDKGNKDNNVDKDNRYKYVRMSIFNALEESTFYLLCQVNVKMDHIIIINQQNAVSIDLYFKD